MRIVNFLARKNNYSRTESAIGIIYFLLGLLLVSTSSPACIFIGAIIWFFCVMLPFFTLKVITLFYPKVKKVTFYMDTGKEYFKELLLIMKRDREKVPNSKSLLFLIGEAEKETKLTDKLLTDLIMKADREATFCKGDF